MCRCVECRNDTWNDKPITLELDHINGKSSDNRLENLRLLCPNCHSQTPTWRRHKNKMNISDEKSVEALNKSTTIHQAIKSLNMNTTAPIYDRCYKLIEEYNIEF